MSMDAKLWALFVGMPLLAFIGGALVGVGPAPQCPKPTAAPIQRPVTPTPQRPAETASPSSWRAVDGDTIESPAGVDYRLMGYDTPEITQAKSERERAMGIRAKERLQAILDAGDVRLEVAGRKDKYGRELGTLFAGDRPVSEIMIGEGLARPNNGERRKPW
jgi:endonuclease YncB( thermonuclease family)